jgi:hypothetical protein
MGAMTRAQYDIRGRQITPSQQTIAAQPNSQSRERRQWIKRQSFDRSQPGQRFNQPPALAVMPGFTITEPPDDQRTHRRLPF